MKKFLTLLTVAVTIIVGHGFTNKVSADTTSKEIIIDRVYNPNRPSVHITP